MTSTWRSHFSVVMVTTAVALLGIAASLTAAPAQAAENQWTFLPDGADYYAEISSNGSELSFACYDGSNVVTAVWFPKDAIPSDVTLLSISFAADEATFESVTYIPNLPRTEGPTRSMVGTPMPDRWLEDARKAKSKIIIGIVPERRDQKQHALWLEFPATGSTAALKSLREKCPQR